MSRTLSCKSHKCVNTTTLFTYVKNSFLQITQMCQHHDRFYICQELFPANHTNVKTPRPFLHTSRTLSCKSHKCVNTTTVFTHIKNYFLQIIKMCQKMPVLTNDRSFFPQITCIKFDMDKELQLLTSYFSCSVSYLLVCCHKSDPLKQDFCMTTISSKHNKMNIQSKNMRHHSTTDR